MNKTVVLIPSYQPDGRLPELVRQLSGYGFYGILVVDDGSRPDLQGHFEECERIDGCIVVHHKVNMGKGAALKTGFRYITDNLPGCECVVTADSDGQHLPCDILKVADAVEQHPESLWLGSRFAKSSEAIDDRENVTRIPLRSRLGNGITRLTFRLSSGISVRDTQTGLRGISRKNIIRFLTIEGDRYEFEMNMLYFCASEHIPVREVSICTVYINKNEGSHFDPLKDSVKVYKRFLKYLLVSLTSFIIDYVIFCLILWILNPSMKLSELFSSRSAGGDLFSGNVSLDLLIAYVGARFCSSLYNFTANKKLVFEVKGHTVSSVTKYYLTVAGVLILSYVGLLLFSHIPGMPLILAKFIVETIMFFVNYISQRKFVFRQPKKKAASDEGEKG